jgi:acetate kinase
MPRSRRILTINGGSSSIKFAIYESGTPLRKLLHGEIQRIGLPGAALQVNLPQDVHATSQIVAAPDFESAIGVLLESLEQHLGRDKLLAIGHRVVHGGPHFNQATRITTEVIDELRRISPFDPEHLPGELRLIDALRARFPDVPQVACFDTAFFHDLPRVAQLLPIPRRFQAQGIRRYGFHGLSYAYLLERLQNTAGTVVAQGRIIMAHLGNGSSLAAIKEGQPLDTSMGFTPTAGVPMSTRSGDLDPGLVVYLLTSGKLNASQFG